ncbi:ribbon-helix-helix protein, CopG family [Kineococcus terrestris]|uniref:ribbon-helix-helix protein, CopG family n=1 Tax=Kineococcus terrestris TaxID=2044856 RepID=UPI0034DB1F66
MSTTDMNSAVNTPGRGKRADKKALRVTVSLTDRSLERVERLARELGGSKTDTINRAIALYDLLEEVEAEGGLYTKGEGGQLERLRLLR